MKKNKVVYLHRKKTNNEVFYVGMGNERRARSKERSEYWKRTVSKHGYYIEIVERGLSIEEAIESEIALIELIGRRDLGLGSLVNLTDGGEGGCGYVNKVINIETGEIYINETECAKQNNRYVSFLNPLLSRKQKAKNTTPFRLLTEFNTIEWQFDDDELTPETETISMYDPYEGIDYIKTIEHLKSYRSNHRQPYSVPTRKTLCPQEKPIVMQQEKPIVMQLDLEDIIKEIENTIKEIENERIRSNNSDQETVENEEEKACSTRRHISR